MPYCPHCGVELDPPAVKCPLCRGALQAEPPAQLGLYPDTPLRVSYPPLTWRRKLRLIGNAISVILFTAVLAVFFADLFGDFQITWSLYCLPPLAAAWCYAGLCLHFYRHPRLLNVGITTVTAILLLLLDLGNGRIEWFGSLGLPIVVTVFVLAGATIAAARWRRGSWALTGAVALTGIALLCIAINLWVAEYVGRQPVLTWALAVMVSMVPPWLFLLYVHYRLRKTINLGKVFHL